MFRVSQQLIALFWGSVTTMKIMVGFIFHRDLPKDGHHSFNFHLLYNILYFPLMVLKGIYITTGHDVFVCFFIFFPGGLSKWKLLGLEL